MKALNLLVWIFVAITTIPAFISSGFWSEARHNGGGHLEFVNVSPDAIVVYCEADRDLLDAFRPLLTDILSKLPHGRITDEEGRPLKVLAPAEMAKYLLK